MRVKKFTLAVITFLIVNVYFFIVWVSPELHGGSHGDFERHLEQHLGGKTNFGSKDNSKDNSIPVPVVAAFDPSPATPAVAPPRSGTQPVDVAPQPVAAAPEAKKRIAVPLPGSATITASLQTKSAQLVRDADGHPSVERRQADAPQRTDVVVGIMTAHKNRAVRDGNRRSFLKLATPGVHKGVTWTYRFILGNTDNKSLFDECVEENKIHNDMVFFDFKDTYQNLTLKTSMAIAYFLENFDFGYFVKLDDDSFLQLDLLLDLTPRLRKDYFAWGFVGGNMNPDRGEGDKWYVPYSEWPGNRTFAPDYHVMHGPCYVLGRDVCEFVYRRTQEPDYIPIRLEDCNMSLLLVEGGYVPVGDPYFIVGDCTPDTSPEWFGCALSKHWCQPDMMRTQYETYVKRLEKFPDAPNCIQLQQEATDPVLHAQTRFNNIKSLEAQYQVRFVNGRFIPADSEAARNAPPLDPATFATGIMVAPQQPYVGRTGSPLPPPMIM